MSSRWQQNLRIPKTEQACSVCTKHQKRAARWIYSAPKPNRNHRSSSANPPRNDVSTPNTVESFSPSTFFLRESENRSSGTDADNRRNGSALDASSSGPLSRLCPEEEAITRGWMRKGEKSGREANVSRSIRSDGLASWDWVQNVGSGWSRHSKMAKGKFAMHCKSVLLQTFNF